jgi:hypothetical protein
MQTIVFYRQELWDRILERGEVYASCRSHRLMLPVKGNLRGHCVRETIFKPTYKRRK